MKKLILAAIAICVLLTAAMPIKAAAYDVFNKACTGTIDSTGRSPTVCNDKDKPQTTSSNSIYGRDGIFTKALNLVSIVVGLAAVVMLLLGGFKFVSSTGDSTKVASARRAVMYAIVGVLTALFAQGIVLFVLDKL
jgi:hypothetical protein